MECPNCLIKQEEYSQMQRLAERIEAERDALVEVISILKDHRCDGVRKLPRKPSPDPSRCGSSGPVCPSSE